MNYLFLILASLILLAAFVCLTIVEGRTGKRMLGGPRKKLDARVRRSMFLIQHVNWSEFIAHMVQSFTARIIHDVAHWSLLFVRFMERELTRIVRYLRNRRPNLLAPKPSRNSVASQTAEYLKKTLRLSDSNRK